MIMLLPLLGLLTLLPGPVARQAQALIERAEMCRHWAGEAAYDAARGQEIAAGVAKARCETLRAETADFLKAHPEARRAAKLRETTADL